MQNQAEMTSGYAYYALAFLMVVYILNFLDRTIIYILFPLVKKKWRFPIRNSRFLELLLSSFLHRQHRGLSHRLKFNRIFE